MGIVIPLFKNNGSRTCIEDYRPITLNCSILIVYEKCILKIMSEKIEDCLNARQHGFRKSHSTLYNLVDFYFKMYERIDKERSVSVISFDLSKAFDVLDNNLLLSKLNNFRFNNKLMLFF